MKRLLTIGGAVILAMAAGVLALRYQTAGKKTLLFTIPSDDGEYSLRIFMIGEPDFPFGSVTCEAVLSKGDTKLRAAPFTMANDGKIPDESQFETFWSSDSVTLLVKQEEADDQKILLPLE